MKTMTCKQMGGPCDTPMHAATAEDMMTEGNKHLTEMASKGDEAHIKAKAMMDKGPDDPDNKAWMQKFMDDFAALPQDM